MKGRGERGGGFGCLLVVVGLVVGVDCCMSGGEKMRAKVVWFVVGNWAEFGRFVELRCRGLRFKGVWELLLST